MIGHNIEHKSAPAMSKRQSEESNHVIGHLLLTHFKSAGKNSAKNNVGGSCGPNFVKVEWIAANEISFRIFFLRCFEKYRRQIDTSINDIYANRCLAFIKQE